MSLKGVDLPKRPDGAFASIATDAGNVATVLFVFSIHSDTDAPLTITDWSLDDMTPRTLSRIVPAAAASLASLREELRMLNPPPDCILIDPGGAGGPLYEQAIAAGSGWVEAITEGGALKYPLLPDRVMAASFYLTCGAVAISKSALEYSVLHRGLFGNHFVRAVTAFSTSKEHEQPSALLVAVVNGVLEAFVERGLHARAITEFAT